MADASSFFNFYRSAERTEKRKLPWFLKLIQTIFILLFMTLLIDIGVVMFVPDGLQMLKDAYNQEVAYLSKNIDSNTTDFITRWVNNTYQWFFVKTGIHDYLYSGGNQLTSNLISGLWPILQGALIGFQIFMIRLSVIVLMLPFLLIVVIVAISDGYLGWFKRSTSGSRESGFIYHRSKNMVSWSIVGLWFIYLLPPFAVNPAYIFIPSIFILAIFSKLSVQFFKKYV